MSAPFATSIPESRAVVVVPEPNLPTVLVPPLEPPTGNALVLHEPPKLRRWQWRKPLPPPDEFAEDANRVQKFVWGMRNALSAVQDNLGKDDWLKAQAPEYAGQVFKDYDVAKASALAALVCVKTRIDGALAAGAAAALSSPTRQRYSEYAATIGGMEAERQSLAPTVEARHATALAAAAKAEQEKRDAERVAQAVRDDLKNLYGERRDNLVARMTKLITGTGYGFSRYLYNTDGKDFSNLTVAEAIIPALALHGTIYFGSVNSSNYLKVDSAKPIANLAELEDLVDALMGKPPRDE